MFQNKKNGGNFFNKLEEKVLEKCEEKMLQNFGLKRKYDVDIENVSKTFKG